MNERLNHPIIIVAPTQRCGTTLLQRAVNSTRTAVVYGENFALTEVYPNIIARWQNNNERRRSTTLEARRRFLQGTVDDEMSALLPDYGRLGDLHRSNFYNLIDFYSNDALKMGFSRWGLKHQPSHASTFLEFCRLVPTAHYLFIYRNIFDVAKSVKARWRSTSVAEFSALGTRWAQNYHAFRQLGGRRVLHIEYDSLVDDPCPWISRIEAVCGIEGISRQVFDRKVNVSDLIDDLSADESETRYREPIDLSHEEADAIQLSAGRYAEEFGYGRPGSPS